MQSSQAVILVDHGSRSPAANAALEAVAMAAHERLRLPVFHAHMGLASPTLGEALARAVAEGARRVVVCPYFLVAGRHGAGDIPEQARRAAAAHPEATVVVSDPLGFDPLLVELVAKRVAPHLLPQEPA